MSQLFKNAVSYLSGGENDSFIGTCIDVQSHRFTIRSVLGEGGFGKVYKVNSLKDGSEFALKRLFVPDDAKPRIQEEITILQKVTGHANICSFVTSAMHSVPSRRGFSEYLILLEFCPGSLSELISASGTKLFTSVEVLQLFYGVCQAVKHLHSLSPPIIHRDVKAENVILNGNGVVKLCDFGSATQQVVQPTRDWSAQQRGALEDEVQCSTTPCFRAPEMVDYYSNYEIGMKADIWALGCFLYFICYFELPYDDNKLAIVNAKYKPPNEHLVMYRPLLPIIRNVFKPNPDSRPTATQILTLLDNIARDKGVDPSKPPFEDFRSRQIQSNAAAKLPTEPAPLDTNSRSSWIGYLKGGAENILKEAKTASGKVVGAVVQASNMYSTDKLDEGQLIITSVTSRIIAVSFPDPNTLPTVEHIVAQKYGTSAYFLNLTDTEYPGESFGGRLLSSGWEAMAPPSMKSLCHVVEVMDRWLLVAPENVVIVHCQDGTGNTALLVASYFLACGLYKSYISALHYYANCRYLSTPTSGGIINASQKRYVEYVQNIIYNPTSSLHSCKVILIDLILATVPLFSVNRSNCKPFLEVYENNEKILSTLREPSVMGTYAPEDAPVSLPVNMGVCGDVRIALYHARNFIGGKMSAIKMFQVCFNTSFIEPECSSLTFSKSKLDGVGRNESKFEESFEVSMSLSVQAPGGSRDPGYSLAIGSLGVKPPVCCASNEEFNKIHSKTPDKGFKKSSISHESVKNYPKDVVYEELSETPDKTLKTDMQVRNVLREDRQTPMSDPVARKSSLEKKNLLVNLLEPPSHSIAQSSSAPDLAEIAEQKAPQPISPDSDFSCFFNGTEQALPSPQIHQRNKSINLLDMTKVDDLAESFDSLGKPPRNDVQVATKTIPDLFDPFSNNSPSTVSAPPDPFLTPMPAGAKTQSFTGNIPSPIVPQRLDVLSGGMSPVVNRSGTSSPRFAQASPRTSPTSQRRSNDPFSDFVLNPKTAQVNFDRPAQPVPSYFSQQGNLPQQVPNQVKPVQVVHPQSVRPNYFASVSSNAGSVFGGPDVKPKTQTDTFADLLSGQQFSNNNNNPPPKQTLYDQRREEMERTMDPIQLRILDWMRGKEGNIRALLSSLGDVLWDGETRWPQPGMHLMIEPQQVKKMYRNASRVVHPDKQIGGPHADLAKAIQVELNDAYTLFEDAEL